MTASNRATELLPCPHCGSVAEYVSEHAKGKRWAVACTMTSKVAADEDRPMCRCRTPFVRDKGQARDIWNARAEQTCEWQLEHGGTLFDKWRCSKCGFLFVEPRCVQGYTDLVPNYCPSCGARIEVDE